MYFLRRKGHFIARLIPSKGHCGILPINGFDYEVEICISDDGLDEKGFVINNKEIDLHFQNVKSTRLSCELLACQAARKFVRLIHSAHGRANDNCVQHASVKIYGLPNGIAHAEYRWGKGDPTSPIRR
jgi:hypothetical protein